METLFAGRQAIRLESVDSTNDFALRWIKENPFHEGLLVVAEEQKAGKGQMGNRWESEKGKNLLFSLVVKPSFLPAGKQFYLSKITALAIKDTIQKQLEEVMIKWPNDIYCRGKKIAGILIENRFSGENITASVIGAGINVNQVFAAAEKAISLQSLTGRETNRELLLEEFCSHFEGYYLALRSGKRDEINGLYLSSLLNFGSETRYRDAKGEFTGIIRSIAEDGRAEVWNKEKNAATWYDIKELVWVNE
ncbi:MAG: biotin--[acetyl-CoA-carboxylase] ligase [Bacteroidota bacterium]